MLCSKWKVCGRTIRIDGITYEFSGKLPGIQIGAALALSCRQIQ
jgi:hypothetical protein